MHHPIVRSCLALVCAVSALIAAEPRITLTRPAASGLIDVGLPVQFGVRFSGVAETVEATFSVTDVTGMLRTQGACPPAGAGGERRLDLGNLPEGYYELTVSLPVAGKPRVERRSTFGVVRPVVRSADQALAGGSRFGIKLWSSGDIWWDRSLKWDPGMLMSACERLGLQWTRTLITQGEGVGVLSTQALFTGHEANVILKIEAFPESCFDVARFGPLAQYIVADPNHRTWNKSTRPLEQPYKEWVRATVAACPPRQRVFEVWNEAWQWYRTMPATEFAQLCNWTVDAIREVRPDAIVGPNIHGDSTEFDLAVIRAGGLRGMDMVVIHPYTAGTPEAKGFRQNMRNYHDLLRLTTGRDLPLYTSEYGWSTSPKGKDSVSELVQAQYLVRESLMLYAEGVRTLVPHTMGESGRDPAEREDWFGLFRLNQEPKPALIAHAVAARMIDGSTFVGDLRLGSGIGAMLFRRDGRDTLALWTEGASRQVTVPVDALEVERVTMTGASERVATSAGLLTLPIDGSVLYLSGTGPALAAQVVPPEAPLDPDLWHQRAGTTTLQRLSMAPVVDGRLDDWAGVPAQDLVSGGDNPVRAHWRLAWTPAGLAVAVEVEDLAIINNPPGLTGGDAAVLCLGMRTDRQMARAGIYDHTLKVAPTSRAGQPTLELDNVLNTGDAGLAAELWRVATDKRGWTAEVLIPWARLGGSAPAAGTRLSWGLTVYDRDRADIDEWKSYHRRAATFSHKGRWDEMPFLMVGE